MKAKILKTVAVIFGALIVVGILGAVKYNGAVEVTAVDILAIFLIIDIWRPRKKARSEVDR